MGLLVVLVWLLVPGAKERERRWIGRGGCDRVVLLVLLEMVVLVVVSGYRRCCRRGRRRGLG